LHRIVSDEQSARVSRSTRRALRASWTGPALAWAPAVVPDLVSSMSSSSQAPIECAVDLLRIMTEPGSAGLEVTS
jgi:hypothetical protein